MSGQAGTSPKRPAATTAIQSSISCAARSGAPRGSIYHHFPGGKAQLIEEATRYAGDFTASGLASALWQEDPIAAIRKLSAGWLKLLRKSDYGAGCPVVAASLAAAFSVVSVISQAVPDNTRNGAAAANGSQATASAARPYAAAHMASSALGDTFSRRGGGTATASTAPKPMAPSATP